MIRQLNNTDLPAYETAQTAAFGTDFAPRPGFDLDARQPLALGKWDGDELVAKLAGFPIQLRLGGRQVSACGIADVTVELPYRRHGHGRELLAELLRAERGRGVALSILYPSVPAVYRSYGYAQVAMREVVRLDSSVLSQARVAQDLSIHPVRGHPLQAAYAAVALRQEGILTPLPLPLPSQRDLVVRREGEDVALLRMERSASAVHCEFLVATDATSWQACLALLGSETGVETVEVVTPTHDPVWHWYPLTPHVTRRLTPMMRPVNLEAAFEARGWPENVSGSWTFAVNDPLLPEDSGSYRLTLERGTPQLERVPHHGKAPHPVAHVAALLAGVRRPGDPQWMPLAEDLVSASALSPWSVAVGF